MFGPCLFLSLELLDPDPFSSTGIYPDLDPVGKISLQFETKFYWNIFKNKKTFGVRLALMCIPPWY
jgi:hypothetical protein